MKVINRKSQEPTRSLSSVFRQFIRTLIQLYHCSKAWSLLCVQVTRQLLYVSAVSWYPSAQTWVLGAAGPTWTPCTMPLTLTSQNWSESCWKLLNPEVHTHIQWYTRQNVNKDYHLLAFKAHLKTRFYYVTFIILVLNKWPFSSAMSLPLQCWTPPAVISTTVQLSTLPPPICVSVQSNVC